ncbi:MAG TPA: hypothetical protein VJL60_02205 [Gammaproteobacteria bacterium]|nr:hypothetical protein [Gammaproteobacteria bacterium]
MNLIETAYLKLQDRLKHNQPLNIQEIFQFIESTIHSMIDTMQKEAPKGRSFSFFKPPTLSAVLQDVLLKIPPEYQIVKSFSKKSAAPH